MPLGDAFGAAAERTRRSVKPPGGRREGAGTRFVEETFGLPQDPLSAGALAAAGPFRPMVRLGALATGAALMPSDAQAGPLDKLVKAVKGIRAWHSSPYDFDKFDMTKIGTGQGAQTYGHGIYAAENPAVSGLGGQYWKEFARHPAVQPVDPDEKTALHFLRMTDGDRAAAIRMLRPAGEIGENALRILESGKHVGPHTYEVNIRARPEEFLDWFEPLNKQSKSVQAAVERAGYPVTGREVIQPRGHDIEFRLRGESRNMGQSATRLRDAGIPGIRYLDQGSRAGGAGTSNYVLFRDDIIDILKKYGLAGLLGGGTAADLGRAPPE